MRWRASLLWWHGAGKWSLHPRHSIRPGANINAPNLRQCGEVDDPDLAGLRAGNVGLLIVRVHLDAQWNGAYGNSLEQLARAAFNRQDLVRLRIGDEHHLSVGSEFEPVGMFGKRRDRLLYLLCAHIDYADSTISGMRRPHFFTVGREINCFRPFTDGNLSHMPVLPLSHRLNCADGVRPNVGSKGFRLIGREHQHVSNVLPGAV